MLHLKAGVYIKGEGYTQPGFVSRTVTDPLIILQVNKTEKGHIHIQLADFSHWHLKPCHVVQLGPLFNNSKVSSIEVDETPYCIEVATPLFKNAEHKRCHCVGCSAGKFFQAITSLGRSHGNMLTSPIPCWTLQRFQYILELGNKLNSGDLQQVCGCMKSLISPSFVLIFTSTGNYADTIGLF
jgi:hypothetical protein